MTTERLNFSKWTEIRDLFGDPDKCAYYVACCVRDGRIAIERLRGIVISEKLEYMSFNHAGHALKGSGAGLGFAQIFRDAEALLVQAHALSVAERLAAVDALRVQFEEDVLVMEAWWEKGGHQVS